MPKISDELRSKCIGARATEAEYAALRNAALEYGFSISRMSIEILIPWLLDQGYLTQKETPDG